MAKHLNKDNMKFIERSLDKAIALEELSNCLDRDSRVILRHIKKYRIIKVDKRCHNKCDQQHECEIKHLFDGCFNGKCSQCKFRNFNIICRKYCEVPCCKNYINIRLFAMVVKAKINVKCQNIYTILRLLIKKL